MTSHQIKVAVIDDSPKTRKQLVKLVEGDPGLHVVVEAETDPAGISRLEEHQPDVILVGAREPFTERIEATGLIVSKFPNTRVIVLSIDQKTSVLPLHSTQNVTASSCQAWACYSLCQNCSTAEILAAIKEGHQSKMLM
jgi:DNA-binding NarL/FixJ family response regulator